MTKGQFINYLRWVDKTWDLKDPLRKNTSFEYVDYSATTSSNYGEVTRLIWCDIYEAPVLEIRYPGVSYFRTISEDFSAIQEWERFAGTDFSEKMGLLLLLEAC